MKESLYSSHRIFHYSVLASTNDEAAQRILSGSAIDGDVIIASRQTGGKGTHGRSFYSEGGLYMSVIRTPYEPDIPLTAFVAVSVARAIDALFTCDCKIKWVNDIYLDQRKLCGILCKRFHIAGTAHTVIGIGVNTNTSSFPEGLNAVSLSSLGYGKIDDLALAKEILRNLDCGGSFMDEYRSRSMILGKEVTVTERDGTRRHGIARRIEDDGALIMLCNGKELRILAGDTE